MLRNVPEIKVLVVDSCDLWHSAILYTANQVRPFNQAEKFKKPLAVKTSDKGLWHHCMN